nr:hypothetical protein [Tanacetum cinerariifolium]
MDSGLVVPVFNLRDDLIACLNQSYVGTGNKGNAASSGGNNAGGQIPYGQANQTVIPYNAAFQTDDLDAYDSDCDDISIEKTVMMANLTNYSSNVLSEVPHFKTYQNDMDNQSVQAMQHFEQTPIDDYPDNKITINYVELNKLTEDFANRFVPQQELPVEQAFWLQTSNPNTKQSDTSPIKIEAPSELPKVNLVNTSLKKLKYYLAKFDTMVKKRITPGAIRGGSWRKLKGKNMLDNAITIAPGMFKLDLEPLSPKLLNNKEAHIDYLKTTKKQADILRGIVKQAKAKQPLDSALDFSCKHVTQIQELLVYVQDTCPSLNKSSEKLIA